MESPCMVCGRYFKIVTVWEEDYRQIIKKLIGLCMLIEVANRPSGASSYLVREGCKPSRPNTKRGELKVPLQFWRGAFRSPRFDKPWRPSPRTERDRKVPSSSCLRRVAVKSDAAARSLRERCASPALSAPRRRHIHAVTRKVSARTRRQSFACINSARKNAPEKCRDHDSRIGLLRNTSCCFAHYVQCS